MSVSLTNYLKAYNQVAGAVLSGALPEPERGEALALVAEAGTQRLQSMNLFVLRCRESCELTEAEKIAAATEGCTIRLHPEKPQKRPRFRFSL